MIPRANIAAWRSKAPWSTDAQVEQDLALSRALVEVFRDETLRGLVAFRGGTALHKIALRLPLRYSEDIDLVQVKPGAIGPVLDGLHRVLDHWLGKAQWKQGPGRATLNYRFQSEIEPVTPMRLKIETNTREHFTVVGLEQSSFVVDNPWFSGEAMISTYALDELLGTKLRALYQRKKGRDLFDLWVASRDAPVNPGRIVACFRAYLEHDGARVSRADFERNLAEKISDPQFAADVAPILAVGTAWDIASAYEFVRSELIALL